MEEVAILVYDVDTVVPIVTLPRLSVVMPTGSNRSRVVEGGPVYLKRSLPAALTTTTAQAQ